MFLTPTTRKSLTRSIRSDPFGGLASKSVEQTLAQMTASAQQRLMRDRQEYGPLIGSGRVSPRVVQTGSMIFPLDDVQLFLAPPLEAPVGQSKMEDHYEAIMRELNAKNDEVAVLSAQRSDQDRTIQLAEAHLRTTESQVHVESQQRDLVVSMAKEVGTGQAEVFQPYERDNVEQTAQTSRMSSAIVDADNKVPVLEVLLHGSHVRTEEATQLLSGSVSSVFAFEGEALKLQHIISVRNEEMSHASKVNDEMKASWNQLTSANAALRAQLSIAEMAHSSEQRDSSMRVDEDLRLRGELTACLAREVVWKSE